MSNNTLTMCHNENSTISRLIALQLQELYICILFLAQFKIIVRFLVVRAKVAIVYKVVLLCFCITTYLRYANLLY